MFDTVALERSDVIAITEFSEQIVENSPVAIARGPAKDPLDMVLQVLLDCVVVEQRIVDIYQKNGRIRRAHESTPAPRATPAGRKTGVPRKLSPD
jgi:hypothetical protein